MRTLLVWVLLTGTAWAAEVVLCDPTNLQVPNAVIRHQDSMDVVFEASEGRIPTLAWDAPNVSMTPAQIATMNVLRSQLDLLRGIPSRYWKCADLTAPPDGLTESVVEMTPTEKMAMDAPILAAQQAHQALETEQASLEAAVDAAFSNWSTLTAAQRIDALRKSMRLNRVERLLGG